MEDDTVSQEFVYRKLTDIPRLSLKERDRRWAAVGIQLPDGEPEAQSHH